MKHKKYTPNAYKIAQKQNEFESMLSAIKEVETKTYLEVGARHGGAFYEVVTRCIPKDGIAVAVDLPGGAWGQESSQKSLENCVAELRQLGWKNVHVIFGDSTSDETISKIKSISQNYDSTFIDGDHRYEGCMKDWDNYSIITNKAVFFHDIDGVGIRQKSNQNLIVEVPEVWQELIKTNKNYKEFIDKENEPERKMGIGMISMLTTESK